MLSEQVLETTWKEMRDYERDHFGMKFGDDFGPIANILRNNKQFMSLGMVTTLLSGLEMSSISQELKAFGEAEKQARVNELLERPSSIHQTFAELFYLGYRMGKRDAELKDLERLTTSTTDRG